MKVFSRTKHLFLVPQARRDSLLGVRSPTPITQICLNISRLFSLGSRNTFNEAYKICDVSAFAHAQIPFGRTLSLQLHHTYLSNHLKYLSNPPFTSILLVMSKTSARKRQNTASSENKYSFTFTDIDTVFGRIDINGSKLYVLLRVLLFLIKVRLF